MSWQRPKADHSEVSFSGCELDWIDSGLCPMAGFGILKLWVLLPDSRLLSWTWC